MRRFLIRLCIIGLLMMVCDVAVGFIGNYLLEHAKGGNTKRRNYIKDNTNTDVLIFGSSRALRHYDPDIFEDTLNLSTYNCGFSSNGIICAYGFYRMVAERYEPKALVYDIFPIFDLLEKRDNHTFLGELRFYYDNKGVDSIFWKVDKTERYKMSSNMYRFNSMLPQLLSDNLHPSYSNVKRYQPRDKEMMYEPNVTNERKTYKYDSLKLYYLERLIQDCEGKTKLIFTGSPQYKNTMDDMLEPIKTLCREYDVPLIDHFTDSVFNYNKEYFFDSYHLNRGGATEYSKVVASEIKQLMEQQK